MTRPSERIAELQRTLLRAEKDLAEATLDAIRAILAEHEHDTANLDIEERAIADGETLRAISRLLASP